MVKPPQGCHFRPRCPHAFERCQVVPDLITRIPGYGDHRDRCWLDVEHKRALREVDGQIGLASKETVIS
jgi:ABC-type antimicrobial peptide transport system ATPase subunit